MAPAGLETRAASLRPALAETLARAGVLDDEGWRKAAAAVPRHCFVPGFYLPRGEDEHGLTIWEPLTPDIDPGRWLAAAYTDTTLITQFDGEETNWQDPPVRHGGAPTSSATLPSLVLRMWDDAQITESHTVLEIGTGSGYSTALACERLGSAAVTSIDIEASRLDQAAAALHRSGYAPTLAVADGSYGYWPSAPFDRIVASCSFRTVPAPLIAQARPGAKILLTLTGWLYGYARALLTVTSHATAAGPLLPGTISFMPARTHTPPPPGNPAHWTTTTTPARPARHNPERITAATPDAFHLRFLAQCAAPNAQLTPAGNQIILTDVVTGSAAILTPQHQQWHVQETGPARLWQQIEHLFDAYDHAGQPGPATFTLHATRHGQHLHHPRMPAIQLP